MTFLGFLVGYPLATLGFYLFFTGQLELSKPVSEGNLRKGFLASAGVILLIFTIFLSSGVGLKTPIARGFIFLLAVLSGSGIYFYRAWRKRQQIDVVQTPPSQEPPG